MTHMHIPDGILPVWIWTLGLIIMVLAVGACVFRIRQMGTIVKVPILGAVSAAMLVAMNLEILPLAYHINLSVVAGILLGPALGMLAAFLTNLMLAFMGHGGITVIGLNTLLLGGEAVLGHTLFYLLVKRFPVFWCGAVATVLTLLITTMALIAIVAAAQVDPGIMTDDHGHAQPGHQEASVRTFAIMVLSLGSIGWLLEATITGAVIRFLWQVKPDLLDHRLHREARGRRELRGPQ